jgi:pseudouridine synthase
MNQMNQMKPIAFPIRLVRFLALAGIASRRKSEALITAGKVSVNGNIVTEPAFKVDSSDRIKYQKKLLTLAERSYVMLNKPRGYLCSAFDPHAEKTVFDLIDLPGKRLFTVGRLDLNSEGLLLLTDDGDYTEKITHPRYGILKKYLVKTDIPFSRKNIELMQNGIENEGEFLRTEKVVKKSGNEYFFTMSEGKKREIRRLVNAVAVKVKALRRLSIGKLNLGKLPTGKWRFLTEQEIADSLKN